MDAFEIRKLTTWTVIAVVDRVDSFNFDDLKSQLEKLLGRGEMHLVLDLEQAQFLSLPCIKYFAEVAGRLISGGGQFALLSPSEKLKRQINIFASLDEMKLFRTRRDLEKAGGQPVPFEKQAPETPDMEVPEANSLL
ncbi:MAG: STAS domain-containing protein [Bdellovibrionales bacterium]|nr:STAS domain-containing protein [Bdellovibrionales bacterium]